MEVPKNLNELICLINEYCQESKFSLPPSATEEQRERVKADIKRFIGVLDDIELYLFYNQTFCDGMKNYDQFPHFYNTIIYLENSGIRSEDTNVCYEKLFTIIYRTMQPERLASVLEISIHMYELMSNRVELIVVCLLNDIISKPPEQADISPDKAESLIKIIQKKVLEFIHDGSGEASKERFYEQLHLPYKADVFYETSRLISLLCERQKDQFGILVDVIKRVFALEEPLPPMSASNFRVRFKVTQALCKLASVLLKIAGPDAAECKKIHEQCLCYTTDATLHPRELLTDNTQFRFDLVRILKLARDNMKDKT